MEKISIIVPVYNTSPYLEKCLDSLVNQTYKNIEIICVNDGSTDNSAEILHRYSDTYSNVIAIDQENQGVSAARNTALAKADGDYLMFVDSDDWVDQRICEKLLKAIRVDNAECAMCSYIKEYENKSIVNHVFPRDFCLKGEKFKRFFYRRLFGLVGKETRNPQNIDLMVSVWMQLFRADLCEGIQFVDLNKIGSAEDCLYQMMVYKNCNTFAYIDEPLYHYRKTNQSSLTTKYNSQLFDRWLCLYDMMEDIINENGYPDIYRRALNNRVCFGLIGLGLNEVRAKKSFVWKIRRFHQICSTKRYSAALSSLKLKYLSFPWKVFYGAMKMGMMFPAVVMLAIIEMVRKRQATWSKRRKNTETIELNGEIKEKKKAIEIQKLRAVELDILKTTTRILEDNGIKSFLIYGTCLGAIRHKGFIPWDDDIDIGLLREDYEKARELLIKNLPEGYLYVDNRTNRDYPYNFGKVKKKGTAFVQSGDEYMNIHHGIYIDLFPLDEGAETIEKTEKEIKTIHLYRLLTDISSMDYKKGGKQRSFYKRALILLGHLLINKYSIRDKIDILCMKHVRENNDFICSFLGVYSNRDIFKREVFGEGTFVEFEGSEFRVPFKYDEYLSGIYGDYMKLPPLDKRVFPHEVLYLDFEAEYEMC